MPRSKQSHEDAISFRTYHELKNRKNEPRTCSHAVRPASKDGSSEDFSPTVFCVFGVGSFSLLLSLRESTKVFSVSALVPMVKSSRSRSKGFCTRQTGNEAKAEGKCEGLRGIKRNRQVRIIYCRKQRVLKIRIRISSNHQRSTPMKHLPKHKRRRKRWPGVDVQAEEKSHIYGYWIQKIHVLVPSGAPRELSMGAKKDERQAAPDPRGSVHHHGGTNCCSKSACRIRESSQQATHSRRRPYGECRQAEWIPESTTLDPGKISCTHCRGACIMSRVSSKDCAPEDGLKPVNLQEKDERLGHRSFHKGAY